MGEANICPEKQGGNSECDGPGPEEPMDVDKPENTTDCCDSKESSAFDSSNGLHLPSPKSAKPLTQEILTHVESAFNGKDGNGQGQSQYKGSNWLEDTNLDEYLELIKQRSQRDTNLPSIYNFSCTFYTLLHTKHYKDGGYESIKESAMGHNIFKFDLVFFPCEINHHWRLVVMDKAAKTILLYDSLSKSDNDNTRCLKNIAMYLKREYERLLKEEDAAAAPQDGTSNPGDQDRGIRKKVKLFFDANIWTVKIVDPLDLPRQANSNDCGVFLLQYAEYLSRRMTFDFSQIHMLYFRWKMAYESSERKLIAD